MTQFKFTLFVIIFIAALFSAGYILYHKQNSGLPTKTSSVGSELHTGSQEVKGSELEAKKDSSIAISDNKKIYTKSETSNHLALTRDNIIWFTNYERVKK